MHCYTQIPNYKCGKRSWKRKIVSRRNVKFSSRFTPTIDAIYIPHATEGVQSSVALFDKGTIA
jgi:hypothetical protein